jgi:hypothetical protein
MGKDIEGDARIYSQQRKHTAHRVNIGEEVWPVFYFGGEKESIVFSVNYPLD